MLLSLTLAWAAVLLTVLTALKYIARISGNRKLNRLFSKCHIPFGVLLLIVGLAHALLAGNPASATLANFKLAPVLLTWNWGTACILLAAMLGLSYVLRRKLKLKWMPVHRVLTVLMLAFIALHLLDVGIALPQRLTADIQAADQTETASPENTPSGSSTDKGDSSASFSGVQLQDGTYKGSADGYKGTITVSVTVSNGKVDSIEVESQSDTPQFFSQAQSVLDEIVDGQSLEVDAVSGATYSSAGLINAVKNALEDAVVSGTLQSSDIDLSTVRQHGNHGEQRG